MADQVLAIGYKPEEFEAESQKWTEYSIELVFAVSAQQAQYFLDERSFSLAIFHSRVLDCLPYIDVMRNMKSVPILVVTPEFANMEQMEQTVQYLREAGMSLERMNTIQSRTFINGDLYISKDERVVRVRGVEIDLTAKEFDILVLLSFNPRRVFTYEMISDIVWNEEYNEYSRKAINNHICNLRKKLKTTPDIPNYIKSVHSVGYKFEPQE